MCITNVPRFSLADTIELLYGISLADTQNAFFHWEWHTMC